MIETAIFIVGLIVGGFCVRAYFEHYMTVDREDAAKARSMSKADAEKTITKLTKDNHTLATRMREMETELAEKTLHLDSEVANYQTMLDQVEEDQVMMEANHKAEIESLQAHIFPPKDYPDDVVDKAVMFDHLHPYFQKMAARQYAAVTDRRKG